MTLGVVALLSWSCGSQASEHSGDTLGYFAVDSRQGEIALVNDDGTSYRRLTKLSPRAADDSVPDELGWSPDGARLAFTAWAIHGSRNYIVEADGSGSRQIGSSENPPQWAPDGSSILIDGPSITVVKTNGLVEHRLGPGSYPAWSPDGRSIAFVRYELFDFTEPYRVRKAKVSALYLVRRDGSGLRKIARTGGEVEPSFGPPVWSPDGTRVAFVAKKFTDFTDNSGTLQIEGSALYVGRRDGSGLRRIAHASGDFGSPMWLPDGKAILVLEGDPFGPNQLLQRIAADGRSESTVGPSIISGAEIAIHPDGDRIAFASQETGIEIIALKSGRGAPLRLPNVNWGGWFLKWSSDGKKLAYIALREEPDFDRLELHVVNADGSHDRRVSKPTEDVDSFAWRPSVDKG